MASSSPFIFNTEEAVYDRLLHTQTPNQAPHRLNFAKFGGRSPNAAKP